MRKFTGYKESKIDRQIDILYTNIQCWDISQKTFHREDILQIGHLVSAGVVHPLFHLVIFTPPHPLHPPTLKESKVDRQIDRYAKQIDIIIFYIQKYNVETFHRRHFTERTFYKQDILQIGHLVSTGVVHPLFHLVIFSPPPLSPPPNLKI